jgi:predicted aspartyl protease
MKKKLIIFITLVFSAVLYSQNADEQLDSLLSNNDIFKLKEKYLSLKAEVSEPMQLLIESNLCSFFNQPAKSNEKIDLLFSKYSDWSQNYQLQMALLMADNNAKLQNYQDVASIYAQLIEQLSPYLDEITLNSFEIMHRIYNSLQNVNSMEISYAATDNTIPLKRDSAGLLTIPVSQFDFVLDFGAGFCMIEEKYAASFGIKILSDSIIVRAGTGEHVHSKIGIADEIIIGNIKAKNVIFLISPDKILKNLPERLSNYEIHGIIGFPVLEAFENLILTDSQLIISKSLADTAHLSNMIIANNALFVEVITSEDTLLMQFDNGATDSYLTNRQLSDCGDMTTDSVKTGSYNSMRVFKTCKKSNFFFQIGTKKIFIPVMDVYIDKIEDTNIPVDGVIGQDIIRKNKETIINFKSMYIDFR